MSKKLTLQEKLVRELENNDISFVLDSLMLACQSRAYTLADKMVNNKQSDYSNLIQNYVNVALILQYLKKGF